MALKDVPPATTIAGCDTIPKLFWQRVHEFHDRIALREKELGIWRAVTWVEYGARVQQVGLGLIALGLRPGDVCSIASNNNKEWMFADLGVLCAGGVSCGVYPTDAARQIAYLLNDNQSRFYFAENEEQLDKVLEIRDRIPSLEKIIVFDMEGLRDFRDDRVLSMESLYRLGQGYERRHPNSRQRCLEEIQPESTALLIYTSGTTGPPKGAMISHRNLLFAANAGTAALPVSVRDEQLSFLPLSHILARIIYTFWPLKTGVIVNFTESPDTMPENLREVSPTIVVMVPRVWEKFYSTIMIQLKDATRFGQWAYRRALAVGERRAGYRIAGKPVPLALEAIYGLADRLVLRNIKRFLGLDRARFMITGAAPVSPDLIRWYWALGLQLFEGYGQTECTGIATLNRPGLVQIGSVGPAVPGTEIRASARGEILIKGPHVFKGYLKQPRKTAETLGDGWLHTGDVGTLDDQGFVKITDRMKDIIITAGGKNITPSEIENQLKFSPFINDAVVIGDRRPYLTCLIMIDQDNVIKFAQDNAIPFTDYGSLCQARAVQDLIRREIERVNGQLARVETLKKFRLIDQQLTVEDDELTPTMKLKRKFVGEKYRHLIDSMY